MKCESVGFAQRSKQAYEIDHRFGFVLKSKQIELRTWNVYWVGKSVLIVYEARQEQEGEGQCRVDCI